MQEKVCRVVTYLTSHNHKRNCTFTEQRKKKAEGERADMKRAAEEVRVAESKKEKGKRREKIIIPKAKGVPSFEDVTCSQALIVASSRKIGRPGDHQYNF